MTEIGPESDIFHDPRIRSIQWRDLVRVRGHEIVAELLLPSFRLAASLIVAWFGWYRVALGLSFMFFLAGLRIVHNAFHHALGLSRGADGAVLRVMSLMIMLGSMDAVCFNHLRHHRLMLGEEDVEGRSADMVWWRALLFGPHFTALLHVTALSRGTRRLKAAVAGQLVMNVVWISVRLWRFRQQSSSLSRNGDGRGALFHGVLRGPDGASSLRSHPLSCSYFAQPHQERSHIRHVPAH